jgi:hypothetical protein
MATKKRIRIALAAAGIILMVFIIGKITLSIQFKNEVEELFSQSKIISDKTFSYKQLVGLPEPVRRYFKHVLKEGQPYISYARIKHTGQFKTAPNNEWADIEGESYFTAQKPGFIWKGTTTLLTARDRFISDKGRLTVSLLSLYPIVDGKGEKFNQGELLRWLGESVWFPTNLLPNERLSWTPIDKMTAKLTFNYNGNSIFYIVTFNNRGEMTQVATKRYMGEENLETWIGKFTDYQKRNGILVPCTIEAIWRLKTGDFSYAKFNVNELDYNTPELF